MFPVRELQRNFILRQTFLYGVSKEHHQRDQKRGKIYQYDMEQAEFQFFPVGRSLKETSNANMAGGGWGVGGQKWPKIF